MNPRTISRRRFLRAGALLALPLALPRRLTAGAAAPLQSLRMGLCADVHKDVMHDADARLKSFIDRAAQSRADFILQLGDFCTPRETNRSFVKIWESFNGPRYHTLGNHDTDGGFPTDRTRQFWSMDRRYYSFDRNGWHFVVLDGNEKKPNRRPAGYARYISAEQLAWLADDLRAAAAPTFIFSHQSLEDPDGVENAPDVRRILEDANTNAKWSKVAACFSGHHHIDYHAQINGIYYIQINSMSYSWLGSKYAHVRYSPEIDKAYPSIRNTAPYRDALSAIVTLDPHGILQIDGIRSEFVGPSPWDLGMPEAKNTSRDKTRLIPQISDRKLTISTK